MKKSIYTIFKNRSFSIPLSPFPLSPFPSPLSPSRGFTLIELLIVVGILGIIATFTITVLNPFEQVAKSRDAQRKSDFAQLQRGLELYYQDTGRYPDSSVDYKISFNSQAIKWGDSWQPYISKVPIDPVSSKKYIYYAPSSANGQTYYLYASLDRGPRDSQSCDSGKVCTSISAGGSGVPPENACGGICNYGVSSSNVSP